MKRAPWVALGALALFVGTLAATPRPDPKGQDVALDFAGIDTLVVEATASASIEVTPHKPPRAASGPQYRGDPAPLRIERRGAALHVGIDPASHSSLEIVAPPGVRTFVLGNGTIVAAAPLDAVEVRLRPATPEHGRVGWSGDARSLRVVDATDPQRRCTQAWCSFEFTVEQGTIGELAIESRFWDIKLDAVEGIGRGTLALGEEANFSLLALSAMPTQLSVVPLGAARLEATRPPATTPPEDGAPPSR